MCRDLVVNTHQCSHQVYHTTHCNLGVACPTPTRITGALYFNSPDGCPDCRGLPRDRVKSNSKSESQSSANEFIPPTNMDLVKSIATFGMHCIIIVLVVTVLGVLADFGWAWWHGDGLRKGVFGKLVCGGALDPPDLSKVKVGIIVVFGGCMWSFSRTVAKTVINSIVALFWALVQNRAARRKIPAESKKSMPSKNRKDAMSSMFGTEKFVQS